MGELLNLDVVSEPTYDWGTAAGLSLRMASRITGRNEVLVPKIIDGDRLSIIKNLCQPETMSHHIAVRFVDYRKESGLLDIEDLKRKISSKTAAVYIENPTYLGCIENQVEEISRIAKENGALFIVGVDPISLGILVPPEIMVPILYAEIFNLWGCIFFAGEGNPDLLHFGMKKFMRQNVRWPCTASPTPIKKDSMVM